MFYRHLVCIDSETWEVRRYEQTSGYDLYTGALIEPRLEVTHTCSFIPSGVRADEVEEIERFRRCPADVQLYGRPPAGLLPRPELETDSRW